MKRYVLGVLLIVVLSCCTTVSAFSPEEYPVISIQFYDGNEPINDGYQVDILLPRDEFNPVWIEEGISPNYKTTFPNYGSFFFLEDTAEYTSYRAYHPYVQYDESYSNDGVYIMWELIYNYTSFQIVIFDRNDEIVYVSEVMDVFDTFGESIYDAEGNHYFIYRVDREELEMLPYESNTSDPNQVAGVIALLAIGALFVAILPFLLIFFGVASIAFTIMIVWIKKGQPKYPR